MQILGFDTPISPSVSSSCGIYVNNTYDHQRRDSERTDVSASVRTIDNVINDCLDYVSEAEQNRNSASLLQVPGTRHRDAQSLHVRSEEGADDEGVGSPWQCAICLEGIEHGDLAVIGGCQHTYCVHCIVHWAVRSQGDVSRCPTCKHPFSKLFVHKTLEGFLCDEPIEETVVLLARASWYKQWQTERNSLNDLTQHAPFRSVEAALAERSALAIAQEEWNEDALYSYFEREYEEEAAMYEDLEDYMEQPRSRIAIGNRRWGANGYIRSGRKLATPVRSKVFCKGQSSGKPNKSPEDANASTSKSAGRRARRKSKRAEGGGGIAGAGPSC